MSMRCTALLLCLLLVLGMAGCTQKGPPPTAGSAAWTEDYEAAMSQARSSNKTVLLDFTGSDWCGWCIKLDEEVFSTREFQDYANRNLVLVKIDFPRKKSQPDAVKAQNEKLAQQHGIQGFPTIVVLDPKGDKLGTLGYMEGGPQAFIAALDKLKK